MFQLVIKPGAIQMAKEAYDWYEEQQTGLGDRFLEELNECYDKIEAIPEVYAKIKGNFRQKSFSVFPYVLVFEILKNDVIVYAFFT